MSRASAPRRRAVRIVGAALLPSVAVLLALVGTMRATDESSSPAPMPTASSAPEPAASPASVPGEASSPEPSSRALLPAPPVPTPIPHPAEGETNECVACHRVVNRRQAAITEAWEKSVHGGGGVTCADCHGGDPTSDKMGVAMNRAEGFIGTPGRSQTVGLCASCHADPQRMRASGLPTDQHAKYFTSVHGQRLASSADDRVAICIDCHGTHDIRKSSDPSAPTAPLNVPALCSKCHADAKLMEPYGIPTDQFEVYKASVHGVALLENSDVRAPSCASCHGSHAAMPPRSTEVVDVCGKCHTATQDLYLQSRHAEVPGAAPKCWTCHGTHDVAPPSEAMFFHPEPATYTCDTCHDLASGQTRLLLDRFTNETDRRCDTCHHPQSDIYAQVEGIAGALGDAKAAYGAASARIGEAAGVGMIVEDADVALSEAKTSLIKAQAAVHTTKLPIIAAEASESKAKADSASSIAQARLDESLFRRQAMLVVIALISANVVALVLIRRRLEHGRALERRLVAAAAGSGSPAGGLADQAAAATAPGAGQTAPLVAADGPPDDA